MSFFSAILVVAGLCLFETVSSIDNAIINAEVLSTMSKRARRWFLIYGILIAVFLVRGLLPWLIVWLTAPQYGPIQALLATFSSNKEVLEAIEASSPILLMGGGVFLVFLFLHWLFLEPKTFGFGMEKFFSRHGIWFYAVASVLLTVLVWYGLKVSAMVAFAAVAGSTAFFLCHGFRLNAEMHEKEMESSSLSDMSKILYLEILDASFSIDGVLGAFAFTFSVPLIVLGNGLGAVIVRQMTVGNIERVKKYRYLKNGAMYSILGLGVIMMLDAYGVHIPTWVSPVATFFIIGYFFYKSYRECKLAEECK